MIVKGDKNDKSEPEQIRVEDNEFFYDKDTMMDSAPDLMSKDDCQVLRRYIRKPEHYNPVIR